MIKYLTGVTHAVVTIPKEFDARQSGVVATVELYFGQGDTSIGGIRYVKEDGRMFWKSPMIDVLQDNRWVSLPVFRGEILLEACTLSSKAVDRIKKQFGAPGWNTRYKVFKNTISVLTDSEGKELA